MIKFASHDQNCSAGFATVYSMSYSEACLLMHSIKALFFTLCCPYIPLYKTSQLTSSLSLNLKVNTTDHSQSMVKRHLKTGRQLTTSRLAQARNAQANENSKR